MSNNNDKKTKINLNDLNNNTDDYSKAIQFDIDAKISIMSLKDALLCTKQICRIDVDRILLTKYISKYNDIIVKKQITFTPEKLLNTDNKEHEFNDSDSDNADRNIIITNCSSKENFYIFMLYKEAFDFYCKYISTFDKVNHFDKLNKEFITVEQILKKELTSELNKAKLLRSKL